MSDLSDEGDQRKVESQPGPSRCPPSRQGYCGYCRVLYSNLDQHLSSLRHLDSVRASSRGSSISSASSSRTKLTLLERFLQDVLQHHPHHYNDPRPSHADLPSVSAPPLQKGEVDELCFSDDDSRSLSTHEHPPNRGAAPAEHTPPSHPQTPPPQTQAPPPHDQSPPSVHKKAHRKTNRRKISDSSNSSPPHRCPDPGPCPDPGSQPPTDPGLYPHPGARPPSKPGPYPHPGSRPSTHPGPYLHPGSQSPTELQPCPDLDPHPLPGPRPPTEAWPCPDLGSHPRPGPRPPTDLRPCPDLGSCPRPGPRPPTDLRPCPHLGSRPRPGPRPRTELRPCPDLGPRPRPGPRSPSELRPWQIWQKQRREVHKEEAFSSDHSDSLDRTIEEVIQMCCHGVSSTPFQQEETESFHFSLPVSVETQSDDWDSPIQRGQTLEDTPVQVEGQDLSRLMDFQVDLEDQVYSYQLDSALQGERRAGGVTRQEQGFWTLPIEEVLPAPEHIPESFKGKSWTQIEQEDEEKVDKLVRQFRRERFICYFDTESLARYGRRSQNKKGHGENKEAETADTSVLPLLDFDDNDSAYVRKRRRKRQAYRVASRCQVVKVSHSTQTLRLVVPAVRQPALEAPPASVPAVTQDAAEKTPEVWRCLPPSYSNIVTPLQPRTSLVYLLCSPSGSAPSDTPAPGSAHKRCRKKRRPLDLQGLKVKYKQLPVQFYDPGSNRILKNPPKGFLWRHGSGPSSPPPSCVRQLFRSLSPDLNADRLPGEGSAGSSRVKGHSLLLSAQTDKQDPVRRRGRTSQAPPPPPHGRSERGRGGGRDRTRPPPSKRRTRAQAAPAQPRREGLRRAGPGRKVPGSAGPPPPPSLRRGRARRGRGCERGRR